MRPSDTIFIDVEVPPRVILCAEPAPVKAEAAVRPCHPNDTDAIWYRAHGSAMTLDPQGSIMVWHAENNLGAAARPVEPNTGHARLGTQGGITYTREVNAGFVVNAAVVEPDTFCCAVRLRSDAGQARTLLTLNPVNGTNYLFLSEKDGVLEWRDDAGTVDVTMPAPGQDMWVWAGYDRGRLTLGAVPVGSSLSLPQHSTGAPAGFAQAFDAANDLFIGCRSHRKGILKTLGASTIHDVLIWLDHAGNTPADLARMACALRYVETCPLQGKSA